MDGATALQQRVTSSPHRRRGTSPPDDDGRRSCHCGRALGARPRSRSTLHSWRARDDSRRGSEAGCGISDGSGNCVLLRLSERGVRRIRGPQVDGSWLYQRAPAAWWARCVGSGRVRDRASSQYGGDRRATGSQPATAGGTAVLVVFLLAGGDLQFHPVLERRQRAGREIVEGTRWVVGFVEVDNRLAIGGEGDVQETARPVGVMATRAVRKHDEEIGGVRTI